MTVYTFQVEEFHTCCVGNVSLLVHNAEYPKPSQYDKALYHNKGKNKGAKHKSATPKDGQASLNKSIPVKPTTTRRVSVEGDKNALKNAGLVNKRGKIL